MADPHPRRKRTARGGPWAVPGFRLLLAGQFTSTLGDYCFAVALPWLLLSGKGGGPVLLGAVLACYGVPRVLTIPLGGVLADRFGGRRVMLLADIARAAATAVLASLAASTTPQLAWLAPIAVVLGACSGLFLPSSYTLLPSLLGKDELGRGNALSTMANQVGGVLGPTAGGALVALFGATPALALDAGSFAVSAFALLRLRTGRTAAEAPSPEEQAPAGPSFGTLLRHGRLLHVVLAVALVANLAYNGTIEVALPGFAHQHLGAGGYGVLLTCLSLGGLAGSMVAARARQDRAPAKLFAVLAVVMGIALGAVPYAGGLPGAAAAIALYSVASGWQNIVAVTMLQTWIPPALTGRVMSLVMLAVMGTFPVSVALAGFGVRRLGPGPFFPIAGAAIAIAVLTALTQRAFRTHRPGQAFEAPTEVGTAGTPPPTPSPEPATATPATTSAASTISAATTTTTTHRTVPRSQESQG
ncbi:MFS transporter [Streptacidiphilus jiangxiensis]|uniref:Predicted arabinose efflux permease, MFS family n=1 Tax=Streptacidiphilus jiangxiensis TaxID=235985 RepID=A0A1H7MVN7_STRJI|nr:MFS transporter [Streptacidiphilus jiangxiensis]SEL15109.1 Predicted arabinose efflux permease, MFS family [Streptacidiphilus jiangxiensis]